jgi:hypothetical protein
VAHAASPEPRVEFIAGLPAAIVVILARPLSFAVGAPTIALDLPRVADAMPSARVAGLIPGHRAT